MVAIGLAPNLRGGVAWLIQMALMAAFLAVIGIATCGKALGVLIDAQKLVSVSRFQAVLWTVIVLSAYLTMALRRIHLDDALDIDVDWHLWALMGISTISLVTAPLAQGSKKKEEPEGDAVQATADALGQQRQEVDDHRRGVLYANPHINDARLDDMFGGDEVGNAAYVDLSKVQMFFFTMISALIYSVLLFTMLDGETAAQMRGFPLLSRSLLGVLALSHGAYVGSSLITDTPKASADAAADSASGPPGATQTDRSTQAILDTVRRIERKTATPSGSQSVNDLLTPGADA